MSNPPRPDQATATIEIGDLAVSVSAPAPTPGVVLVFSAGEPLLSPIPVGAAPLELGRGTVGGVRIEDGTMSRKHATIAWNGRAWQLRDLGSRNGIVVDGLRVLGELEVERPRVLRLGESIFLFSDDLRRFESAHVQVRDGRVVGPTLARVWDAVASAATTGETLHVTGESGSGKEAAAHAFHDLGPRKSGPFIAVNCAAIPEGVAERLLFGARKGAYSGAHENVEGYIQAANGGTLFLDEVGELDLQVQAKLLRVLETKEAIALGDSRPRRVDVRFCSATNRDLRRHVSEKRFREDLYFRIGRPIVAIPPLRERLEEIPFFIDREVPSIAAGARADASFVEACLLRHWPGNVRELLAEIREAARHAHVEGFSVVTAERLASAAGVCFEAEEPPAPEDPLATLPPPIAQGPQGGLPSREAIEAALRQEAGRIATAARALGIHRNQLRRWLTKHNVDPRSVAGLPSRNPADETKDGEDE